MSTQCYAMVRGSTIRVTGLGAKGEVQSPAPYAVSRSVAEVRIDEVTVAGANEVLSTPEEERRIKFQRSAQTIRYKAGIRFLKVDPGILSLVAGVQLVYGAGLGFGGIPFGVAPFGGTEETTPVVGFDAGTRLPVASFALEVWSKLDQNAGGGCSIDAAGFDEGGFDEDYFGGTRPGRRWGYTLFPYLKGGYIEGFTFENGLISFNLTGAQTRRMPRWGVGPYDLEGPYRRLLSPVSRNTHWRSFVAEIDPPVPGCGLLSVNDVLDNGTAANPMPDPAAATVVDGGGATNDPWIIEGGRAT